MPATGWAGALARRLDQAVGRTLFALRLARQVIREIDGRLHEAILPYLRLYGLLYALPGLPPIEGVIGVATGRTSDEGRIGCEASLALEKNSAGR